MNVRAECDLRPTTLGRTKSPPITYPISDILALAFAESRATQGFRHLVIDALEGAAQPGTIADRQACKAFPHRRAQRGQFSGGGR